MNSSQDYIIEEIIENTLKDNGLEFKPKLKQYIIDVFLEEVNKRLLHIKSINNLELSIQDITAEAAEKILPIFSLIYKTHAEKTVFVFILNKMIKYVLKTMVICIESGFDNEEREKIIQEAVFTSAMLSVALLKDEEKIDEKNYKNLMDVIDSNKLKK